MPNHVAALPRPLKPVGLLHALLATGCTAGVPVGAVLLAGEFLSSAWALGFVAVGFAIGASTVGTAFWMRQPASD